MNGWSRVPDTLQARCRVGDYLRRPAPRAPWIRVLRVARQIELFIGDAKLDPWLRESARRRIDAEDAWNDAIKLVERRRREREEARRRTPSWERVTHELTPSGDLRPIA